MQSAAPLNPAEVEVMVRGLRAIPVEDVGSAAWKEQRQAVEELNGCSHSNAQSNKDDYVLAMLVQHEMMPVLLHELLVAEVWRRRVLPSVTREVIDSPAGVYLYCNYEMILLNFLECLLFHEEAVTALGDDVLELIDYAWRQISQFLAEGQANVSAGVEPLPSDAKSNPIAFYEQQDWHMRTVRAMTSISVLWFTTDRVGALPMAATNAILQKHDLLVGFSDVLLMQPWLRRGPSGPQLYVNGAFEPTKDAQRVCIPQAHCWFLMHKLLCDRECRRKYHYTTYKKEAILRVKRFLNDVLVDQLPALVDVQRALEEMSFLEPPSGTEEKFKSTLIIEPVARLMNSIDNPNKNWNLLADKMRRMLADPAVRFEDAQRLSRIFDKMMDLGAVEGVPPEATK